LFINALGSGAGAAKALSTTGHDAGTRTDLTAARDKLDDSTPTAPAGAVAVMPAARTAGGSATDAIGYHPYSANEATTVDCGGVDGYESSWAITSASLVAWGTANGDSATGTTTGATYAWWSLAKEFSAAVHNWHTAYTDSSVLSDPTHTAATDTDKPCDETGGNWTEDTNVNSLSDCIDACKTINTTAYNQSDDTGTGFFEIDTNVNGNPNIDSQTGNTIDSNNVATNLVKD